MTELLSHPMDLAPRVYTLHPGDVACVDRDDRMETLLGSCVAIVLTDPRRTVGAMCHVVHARPGLDRLRRNAAFGDVALVRMFALLRARAIEPRLCVAWAFGGGNMFPTHVGPLAAQGNVGEANAAWALHALREVGIPLLGSSLGGTAYRRVGWTVGPGEPDVQAVSTLPAGACA